MDHIRDKIRGSLIGGAAGDALGYAVEFSGEEDIFSTYGKTGITDYHLSSRSKCALISDDTQMTLFTASALLFSMYRLDNRGICGEPRTYALYAYLGWLKTQEVSLTDTPVIPDDWRGRASFILRDVPQLYKRRAPGQTCLTALMKRQEQLNKGIHIRDFIADKLNNSKGCGGIMRVAPLGTVLRTQNMAYLDMEGAQLAAITHSHSLGYMPAAVLVHIVNRCIYAPKMTLKEIVMEARDTVAALFKGDPHLQEMTDLIDLALRLAENKDRDLDNIHRLGEGWVAEETLAIAIYCAVKYETDFSRALIASVNHRGDSDSTGAVTGNIIGAITGYDSIASKWKKDLELHDVILDIADKLYADYRQ